MGLQMSILQLCLKYHSCLKPVIRLCGLGGRLSLCLLPHHRRWQDVSHNEEDVTGEDENAEVDKGRSRLQVTAGWHQMAKKCRNTLILKTPSLALARSLVGMRTQTQSLTPGRKFSLSGKGGAQKAPGRTAPLRNPANHLLRKSCHWMRHSMMRPGKKLSCWTHIWCLALQKDC